MKSTNQCCNLLLEGEDAIGKLYPIVKNIAYGIFPRGKERAEETKDWVQEAMIHAWLGASKYDPGKGSFKGWFSAVVANFMRDKRRKLKRALSKETHNAGTAIEMEQYSGSLRNEYEDQMDEDHWEGIMNTHLPAPQRELMKKLNEGFSNREIAKELNTTENNVRVQHCRARKQLEELAHARGSWD